MKLQHVRQAEKSTIQGLTEVRGIDPVSPAGESLPSGLAAECKRHLVVTLPQRFNEIQLLVQFQDRTGTLVFANSATQ